MTPALLLLLLLSPGLGQEPERYAADGQEAEAAMGDEGRRGNRGTVRLNQTTLTRAHDAFMHDPNIDHEYHARTVPIGRLVAGDDEEPERRAEPRAPEPEHPWIANCTDCWTLDKIREKRLETIQREILSKLRMKEPPKLNLKGKPMPRIPPLEGFQEHESLQRDDDGSDEYYSTTERVIIFGERPPAVNLRTASSLGIDVNDMVYFGFKRGIASTEIDRATFNVYLRRRDTHQVTQLLIYLLERRRGRLHRSLLERKPISLNSTETGRWHAFYIKRTVMVWLRRSRTNMGLEVQARDGEGRPFAILQPDNDEDEPYKPFMELKIKENTNSRSKRMLSTYIDCKEQDKVDLCCRYELYADFDEFGWDFIIQPRRYNAFFCAGNCPFYFNPAYSHSHVVKVHQSHNENENPVLSAGGPCCTPIKMSRMAMIYFDDNNFLRYGVLPGMAVEHCGCA